MTWRAGMARAYERGLADGGTRASNGGFGHGSRRCICPEKLAGKRWGQRCVVCGMRRHS